MRSPPCKFCLAVAIRCLWFVANVASADFQPITIPWTGDDKYKPTNHKHNWCSTASNLQKVKRFGDVLRGSEVSVVFFNDRDGQKDDSSLSTTEVDVATNNLTGGLLVEVWQEAAARAELKWKSSFAVSRNPDPSNVTETYEILYQWAADNYDVVVDWIVITPARAREQLRFAYPFLDVSTLLIGVVSVESPPWYTVMFSFLRPFSWSVWIAILLSFLIAACAYRLLEKGQDDIPPETLQDGTSYRTALYLTAANFTAGGGAYMPKTMLGRVFAFGFNFGLLMIVGAYTANLASLLVVKAQTSASITGIEDAVAKGLTICVAPQGYSRWVLDEYPNLKHHTSRSTVSTLRDVIAGKCVAAVVPKLTWQVSEGRKSRNPDCTLGQIGEPLRSVHASFVFRADEAVMCTAVIADYVTVVLQEMVLDGWIDAKTDEYFRGLQNQDCALKSVQEEDSQSLGLKDVSGIFMVQALVLVACLIVYFLLSGCKESPKSLLLIEDSEEGTDHEF